MLGNGALPQMKEIVLASASPRRRELLTEAKIAHRIVPSHVAEPEPADFDDPAAYVMHVAWMKCNAVAQRFPQEVILAADTTCAASGQILGKATDRNDARRILRVLAGTVHHTLTGICMYAPRLQAYISAVETTAVRMRSVSDTELERYLDTGQWVDKAGAYGIQNANDPFVESIEGSYSNVMGLPMERLQKLMADIGWLLA